MTSPASRPEAWFEKVEHDLQAVDHLMTAPVILWDVIAYHAQQGAEKYLKGYLVWRGEPAPRIHDLVVLLTSCGVHDESLLGLSQDCERLSRLGWISRYPDGPDEPDEQEARSGVEIAHMIRSAIRQRTAGRPPARP